MITFSRVNTVGYPPYQVIKPFLHMCNYIEKDTVTCSGTGKLFVSFQVRAQEWNKWSLCVRIQIFQCLKDYYATIPHFTLRQVVIYTNIQTQNAPNTFGLVRQEMTWVLLTYCWKICSRVPETSIPKQRGVWIHPCLFLCEIRKMNYL